MTNFPVNPDISAVSEVVYTENLVVSTWGKNYNQDEMLPVPYTISQREFVYVCPTNYTISDWNDEATNGYQNAEWVNAWGLFIAYYENILIPNKIVLLQVFDWKIDGFHSGTKFQPRITFKYLPFLKSI